MIDVSNIIVSALSTIGLKVYNENFINSSTKLPCITYKEFDNSVLVQGNTLGYSNNSFHVTVWGNDIQTLINYSSKIDKIMRSNGFTRVSMNDLWLDNIGQRKMKYTCKLLENFE